jgi:hypothetical protein
MTNNGKILRALGAIDRRRQRERIAKGLAIVKAAKRAGLPVRSATIEGVALEFGEADAPTGNRTHEFRQMRVQRNGRKAGNPSRASNGA